MAEQSTTTLRHVETVAIIAVGAFAGSNLRFLAIELASPMAGILVANVLGSLLLGFLVYEAQYMGVIDRRSRLLFTTGFLSSLTTYSGFVFQTATAGEPAVVVGYALGTYALGFTAVLVGRELARRMRGEPA